MPQNLFQNIPPNINEEIAETLLNAKSVRIERIISHGQKSPKDFWYDQDEHEWVIVLKGEGRLMYPDGKEKFLKVGDFVNIPAHTKHRVSWTNPNETTVWLAIFYR